MVSPATWPGDKGTPLFHSFPVQPPSLPIHLVSPEKAAVLVGVQRLQMLPKRGRKMEFKCNSLLAAKASLDLILSFILEPEAQK